MSAHNEILESLKGASKNEESAYNDILASLKGAARYVKCKATNENRNGVVLTINKDKPVFVVNCGHPILTVDPTKSNLVVVDEEWKSALCNVPDAILDATNSMSDEWATLITVAASLELVDWIKSSGYEVEKVDDDLYVISW